MHGKRGACPHCSFPSAAAAGVMLANKTSHQLMSKSETAGRSLIDRNGDSGLFCRHKYGRDAAASSAAGGGTGSHTVQQQQVPSDWWDGNWMKNWCSCRLRLSR